MLYIINDIDTTKDNNIDNNLKKKILKSRNLALNNIKGNNIFPKTISTFKEYNSINSYNNKLKLKINISNKSFNSRIYNDKKKNYFKNKDEINLKSQNKNIKSKSLNNYRNKTNLKLFNIKTYSNNSKFKLTKNKNNNGRNFNQKKLNKNKIFHSYDFKLQNNFEREYLDKYLTTKKYQDKYFNYDKLMKKELKFQKCFLKMKNYHSNLYFEDYQEELRNNELNEGYYNSKEKAFHKFLVINNKIND